MQRMHRLLHVEEDKAVQRSQTFSFAGAVLLHVALIGLLILSFEKTITLPPPSFSSPDKPIIDAVMVNRSDLNAEVQRLENREKKKRQQEQLRQEALAQKENEAKLRREQEEVMADQLKKQNEALKKEAQLQQLAQQKLAQEQKVQQEELKKIKKEKEAELLAKKKIQEQQKKAAEQKAIEQRAQQEKAASEAQAAKEAKAQALANEQAAQDSQQQANVRVRRDQIAQYAILMRNKIHQYWRQPVGFDYKGLTCKITVRLLPTGEVLEATVVASSGNLEFDRSAELAVRKASPLPMPEDVNFAKEFSHFSFTFYPETS